MFIAASTNEPIHVDSVSALNASRSAYDGREIVVRGYIEIGPEQLYLLDRRFDSDDAWTKASGCLSLLDVGDIGAEATRLNGQYVELSGTFVKDNLRHGASLMVCGETGVDLHSDPKRAIRVLDRNNGHLPGE